MEGAVVDHAADAGDRGADQGAFLLGLDEALVAGRNVLPGDDPAHDLIDEFVLAFLHRLHVARHPAELTGTAGLLLVGIVEVGPLGNGFPVGDLGGAHFDDGAVFPLHPFNVNVQVQLAHAGDDGFAGFRVKEGLEGGVFLGEAVKGLGHVDLGLVIHRLDRQGDNRVGHVHGTHRVVDGAVGEGIAGGAVDPEQGHDIAGTGGLDLLHFVGVHPHQTADLALLAGADIDDGVAFFDGALVGADIGKLAVTAVFQLEGQGDQGIAGLVGYFDLGLVVIDIQGEVIYIGGARQVIGHRVQQFLDPLVLVGRSDHNRGQFQAEGALADGGLDHLFGGAAFQHRFHQLVGEHGGGVEQGLAGRFRLVLEVGGNFRLADDIAVVAFKIDRLHGDQVDHPGQIRLQTDGQLYRHRVEAELVAQLLGNPGRIGAGAVALIDKGDPRYPVTGHLAVDGDALGLHPAHRTEDQDRSVQHPQGAFDFDGEINVAGGVDDVDRMALPVAVGGGRGDGDAALPLQLHGVHLGPDPVLAPHLVNGVNALGVVQDALGQGGFARIDVGADPDVPDFIQISHALFLVLLAAQARRIPSAAVMPGVVADA